jgi:phage tail-like protein
VTLPTFDPFDPRPSTYLDHLPALFRDDPFLGRFLRAFESILSGPGALGQPSLEETIDRIATLVDPGSTPEELLDWLAGWVGVSLRAEWTADAKRRFLQQAVALYRKRGTREGLVQMLRLYTGQEATVDDAFDEIPHYFQVKVKFGVSDVHELGRKQQIARDIVDREKPAHTFYGLTVGVPRMRLVTLGLQAQERAAGRHVDLLIVARNTIIGSD